MYTLYIIYKIVTHCKVNVIWESEPMWNFLLIKSKLLSLPSSEQALQFSYVNDQCVINSKKIHYSFWANSITSHRVDSIELLGHTWL